LVQVTNLFPASCLPRLGKWLQVAQPSKEFEEEQGILVMDLSW
jgi:hypothetical protein